ncbi:MAG: leucine-rich repeat protein [Ureaplasma sp.]|nr:leucine-rich repeat protein [Ureaplasma sp.]
MDSKQDKFSNMDDYDLILEEKEKELKKEKRNKRILASSLLLLLLLGSTAVVAPIISVAVNNKNNSANINNIKIPSTLTFINSDITTLIDGYKSEIQTRKLSFDEFKQDFINLTKKHIVASNLPIGTIVKSAKITQNVDTRDFNIEIVLDESKEYLASSELTPATLNKNTLTISFEENEKLLGDFFTPIQIDTTILDNLKDQIQGIIDNNKLTDSSNDLNSIKNQLRPNINPNQIGNIRYEEPNLIIEPIHPNKFTPSDSNWIVDGNIVISNLKLYTLIKFSNLQELMDSLNSIIHTDTKQYEPKEFNEYINQNLNEIKKIIYTNLKISNKNKFKVNDILNILINDNFELVIQLSTDYLKYKLNESNTNFELNNNQLIIKNLDFKVPWSPDSWFIYKNSEKKTLTGLTDQWKKQSHIIIPGYVTRINQQALSRNDNIEILDMSLMKQYLGSGDNSTNGELMLLWRNKNLRKIILNNDVKSTIVGNFQQTKLENIVFPKNFNKFDTRTFIACNYLKWVYFSSEVVFYDSTPYNSYPARTAFSNNVTGASQITIYVPTEELKQYYEQFNFVNARIEVRATPPEN